MRRRSSGRELQAVKVRLTKADIRDGQANDCWTCPVARALRKAFARTAGNRRKALNSLG